MSEGFFVKIDKDNKAELFEMDDVVSIIRADFEIIRGFMRKHSELFDKYLVDVRTENKNE